MKVADDNGAKLIRELEAKRGGSISWRTYSIFYADSSGRVIENGVFVYRIGDDFWLEDFEKVPSIFGIKIDNPRNYSYEKFERRIQICEFEKSDKILKKDAVAIAEGRKKEVSKAGKLASFFGESVTRIKLKDNSVVFLQLMDNELLKQAGL